MDPFQFVSALNSTSPGKKTDEQLWTALEIALVKDAVSDMPDGLDTKIVDEGRICLTNLNPVFLEAFMMIMHAYENA